MTSGRSAVSGRTADSGRTGVTRAPAGSPVPVGCRVVAGGEANGCHDGAAGEAAVGEGVAGGPAAGDGGGVAQDGIVGGCVVGSRVARGRVAGDGGIGVFGGGGVEVFAGGASVVGAARGCAAEDPKSAGTSCSDGGGSSPSSIFRPCRMRARTARSLRHDRARHHVNVPPSPSGRRSWLPCVRGKADISWRSTIKPSSPKAGDVAQCDYLTTINNDNLAHDHCSGVQSKSSTLSLFSQFNRHNTCALFSHSLRADHSMRR